MKNRVFLGIDASTKCIGLSVYEIQEGTPYNKGTIHLLEGLDMNVSKKQSDIEALCLKMQVFEKKLLSIPDITDVVIEEPLFASNNIFTAAKLLRFNGMLTATIYYHFGIVPHFISSYDSRYYAFPQEVSLRRFNKKGEMLSFEEIHKAIKKDKLYLFGDYTLDIDKKHIVLDRISEIFPQINWLVNSRGNIAKENYDGQDSLTAVLGFLNKERVGGVKLSITNMTNATQDSEYIEYNTSFGGEEQYKHVLNLN